MQDLEFLSVVALFFAFTWGMALLFFRLQPVVRVSNLPDSFNDNPQTV